MWRRAVQLVTLAVAVLGAVVVGGLLPGASGRALAAPTPNAIVIEGPGLARPLTVAAAGDPDQFKRLLSEVAWIAPRTGDAPNPDNNRLGPKYVIVVQVDGQPDQTCDLYPLASGGPRIHRPAGQPRDRKANAAWFYGRVSMPETLRLAGVPLGGAGAAAPGLAAGGQGGGGEAIAPVSTGTPASIDAVVSTWQRGMLLLGGGAVLLLALLAGFALLFRRT